ncbi:MAG: tetratricopeptide repeat protein [Acidobacteriota bacterium]
MRNVAFLLSVVLLLSAAASEARGESGAGKNRNGNRLFSEGRFPEAERAYLEAQADLPERPEIFYNLGNALIKQKKYDLGLQALRQAGAKGDRDLQAASWFNSGNALFEMGNYADAAQAYIQALRLRPSDRDAKHNLELALRKRDEQPPESGAAEQPQQNPRPQQESRPQDQPQSQEEQNQPADPRSSRPERQEGSFTREQALQILDALQNQELAEQRKQIEQRMRRRATGRDW